MKRVTADQLADALVVAAQRAESTRFAPCSPTEVDLETLRSTAAGAHQDVVEALVSRGFSNQRYIRATTPRALRLTAGLLLAVHEAADTLGSREHSDAVWAFAWSWAESAVTEALSRPSSWGLAHTGCRHAGLNALAIACESNLRSAAEALSRGARWAFLDGSELLIEDAELFAPHPDMFDTGDTAVIPFAERLVARVGVPQAATASWLAGLPVDVVKESLNLGEVPSELLKVLSTDSSVPLQDLASALQALDS